MGNQGMTNWKFSAFLTIALMLVAGMFTSTAIAAPDDGAGSITVQWASDNDTDVATRTTTPLTTADTARTTAVPLPSGSTGNAVQFTYTVPAGTDMSSGAFKLLIPSGWMVSKKLVTITDSTIIYETDAAAAVDTALNGTATGNDDADTRKRVTILPSSGDTIASVEVALDADWATAGGTLIIRFDNVTAAIPTQLPFTTETTARSYQEYQFTASSRETGGTLRRLRPPVDDAGTADIDESDVNPQPYVRVGNAADGTGAVTITPDPVYEGEPGRDFRITYTAAGPMYNSRIKITIPDVLIPDDAPDGPTDGDTTTGSADDGADFIKARTTVTQRGGVNFGQVSETDRSIFSAEGDDGNGSITIYIDRMAKGGQVRVFYENIDVQAMDAAAPATEMFAIETDTNEDTTLDFETNPFIDPKPARVVANDKGKVHPVVGSGKVVINPAVTQINARPRPYSITYTPATKLGDAWLVVQLPVNSALSAGLNTTGSAFVNRDEAGVSAFTEARVDSEGRLNPAYVPAATDQTLAANSTFVSWKVGPRAKGTSFTKTINELGAAATSGVYPWNIWLLTTAPDTATSTVPTLAAARIANDLYILQTGSDPLSPDVDFAVTSTTPEGGYRAASTPDSIEFTFTAVSTPIKDGSVSFSLPSGWTPATKTADKPGQVTVQTDTNAADTDPAPANLDIKHVSIGTRITVKLETLPKGGRVIVTYKKGMLQREAGEAEIRSWFKAGASLPERVSDVEELTIVNVADGSGTATITPSSVEAGSDDNTLHVMFKTMGSMDTGRVRLTSAPDWGDFQDTNSSGKNYVTVSNTSGSVVSDTTIANDTVTAHLSEFGYGDTVTFTIKNVLAQRWLGIANFKIESAGSRNGSLRLVRGEEIDKRADKKPIDLIGRVYQAIDDAATTDVDESTDGLLRVAVTGGGDGSGTVDVSIIASKAGPAQYEVTADDGTVSTEVTEQVHVGDDETHLRFTYKPVETIADGELRFTVATGWSPPQVNSVTTAGYTSVSSDGLIGSVTVGAGYLTVPIFRLEREESIVINYGTSGGGAVAPGVSGPSAFDVKTKGGTTGSLASVSKLPTVMVRPQASGTGAAVIDTGGNVYAGDTERTFTITYTAIGQIVGGKLKVTVPDGDDWADATDASIDVSAGNPVYGGTLSATALADNADVGSVNDLVISNINMAADQTLTVTYMSDAPPKAGDVTFAVSFDGGHGPGPDTFEAADKVADLSVTVMEARAGSGMVAIDQMGEVVAGSEGNDLTITYTVAGEIKGTVPGQTTDDRLFRVQVPAGWSAPSAATTADTNMGTYAVEHSRMDATTGMYAVRTTEVEKQPPAKADGAAADDPTVYMVARVKSEQAVVKGDKITFTYENATAPAMPEKSTFRFFFDGVQVTPDLNVIVQSAEGATALGLEAAADFTIEDGPTTVTVKLMGSDGNVATRSEDTVVTLTADGGTIAPSVTIEAGSYHAETELSATASGHITVTATATGLTDGTAMVTADTNNVMITNVSLSQTVAKAGDAVTVTATGSAAQDGTFSVGSVITDMALTEDEAGSYTGSFDVVADLQDGMHTVTVSLNGASDSSASITIDTVAPTATAVSSADEVSNGDMVTISATADDGTGSGIASVMADVSKLDDTQDMVALTMGDDGSYSAEIMISEDNERANGPQPVTVTATDMAGNMSDMATVSVTLNNELSFTSTLPAGISLFSVPLDEVDLDTVGDLEMKLGDSVNLLITYDGTNWNSRSGDVAITGSLGILVSMAAETTVTFTGYAWEDTTVSLAAGSNLVGLPVNDASVANISDIAGLFDEGVVTNVIASSGGEFQLVAAAGDPADGPVAGDAAYLVMASAAGDAMLSGAGWMTDDANAAPIALSGYTVDNQTPVLDVHASIVDEITGLAKDGFRVKVKNLATKAALSSVIAVESTDGYNVTFVDLDEYAARVGDVLEITVESSDPLIGVKPVRHTVTVDDVKNSHIELEDLIAYEIPAETELLRNYPNPFNPETWIPYRLAEDANVSLTIYDVNGVLVRSIDVGHQTAAVYDTQAKAIYWDGRNQFGEQVASGIYFYSLEAGDFSATRKMVILK